MKAWDDRGYRTYNERQQDSRDLAAAMKEFNSKPQRMFVGRPSGDPLYVPGDEPTRFDYEAWHRRMRRDDARMFLSIGIFIGAGIGFVVGVWFATR